MSEKEGSLKQVTLSKFFASKNQQRNDDFETVPVKKNKGDGKKGKHKLNDEYLTTNAPSSKRINSGYPCTAVKEDGESGSKIREEDVTSSSSTSLCSNGGHISSITQEKLNQFLSRSISENVERTVSFTSTKKERTKLPGINSDTDVLVINSDDDQKEEASPSTSAGGRINPNSTCKFSEVKIIDEKAKKATKAKYTPLEQQFVEIKEKHPGAILMVECGYKYRFFGEDAETAAKVLKIFCHPDHNFMTASIPTHRLFVHVRRLVAAGYKVGVVKQTETAALKAAGDNRSTPFSRQLKALYTKATLIGEDVDPLMEQEVEGGGEVSSAPLCQPCSYLMCVVDGELDKHQQIIGIVALDPGTGDMVYDCFSDGESRLELETRITHIQPVELLISADVSNNTARLVKDLALLSSTEDDRIRVEQLPSIADSYPPAFEVVSDFYAKLGTQTLQTIINFPRPIISCLACLINYLKDFNLQGVLKLTGNLREFSAKSHYMQLSASTIRNLELFHNATDGALHGSLLWLLDHTVTRYGARLFKQWLARPLLDPREIQRRYEAVEEINNHPELKSIQAILARTPDIEKGLHSIFHRKCSTGEFYLVAKALEKIFEETKQFGVKTSEEKKFTLLWETLSSIPELLEDIKTYSNAIYEKAAKENNKTALFKDESQFPAILSRKKDIKDVITQLKNHQREIRTVLKQLSFDYTTVLQTEFLIEVKNTQLSCVPQDWIKINSTKVVSRFHSPFVVENYKKLCQLREQLVIDATQAWMEFLESFSENYQRYRKVVQLLATLDCLFSLARTARQDGNVRPEIDEEKSCIDIKDGRHPVIEALLGEQQQFVPNGTHLHVDGQRVMVITGPNMGGKSSYIRQVAVIAIMAQVGCFVPARQARLGILDSIHTRMGAADEIFKGRSTFMVELQEAAEIMTKATEKSLVILDELGRGTSTHDGVAIAYATLNYFINQVKCLTLFVTHYPILSEFQLIYPDCVRNFHMAFFMQEDENEDTKGHPERITFLYQLAKGSAAKSYGLNVARLADIEPSILHLASQKSEEMEQLINNRRASREGFIAIFHGQSVQDITAAQQRIVCLDEVS